MEFFFQFFSSFIFVRSLSARPVSVGNYSVISVTLLPLPLRRRFSVHALYMYIDNRNFPERKSDYPRALAIIARRTTRETATASSGRLSCTYDEDMRRPSYLGRRRGEMKKPGKSHTWFAIDKSDRYDETFNLIPSRAATICFGYAPNRANSRVYTHIRIFALYRAHQYVSRRLVGRPPELRRRRRRRHCRRCFCIL